MGNALRWLWSSALVLATVVIAASALVLVAGLDVDMKPLRSALEGRLSETLGRPLTISGPITLKGGRHPVLHLQGVHLTTNDPAATLVTAEIANLRLGLDLSRMLRGRSAFDGFGLTGAEARLISSDGNRNIEVHLDSATLAWDPTRGLTIEADGEAAGRPLTLNAMTEPNPENSLAATALLQLGATRVELSAEMALPLAIEPLNLRNPRIDYSEDDLAVTLNADELNLAGRRELRLERLRVSSLNARVGIGEDGVWRIAGDLGAVPLWIAVAPDSRRSQRGSAGSRGLVVLIGTLLGEGSHVLTLEDRHTDPDGVWTLALDEFSAEDVDTSNPIPATRIQGTGRIGSQAWFKALITPGGTAGSQALFVEGGAIDLRTLTARSRAHGFDLTSGTLDFQLRAELLSGRVDGEIEGAVRNLSIDAPESVVLDGTESALPVSVHTAVRMMSTSEGNLRLTVPVSGHIDPQGLKMELAVSEALTDALLPVLTSATETQESLRIAALLGSTDRQLAALLFTPREAALNGAAKDYLAALASALRQVPGSRLTLCGRAAETDGAALTETVAPEMVGEALETLRTRRGEAARNWLIRPLGIAPARLELCRGAPGSAARAAEPGAPRVDLTH